MVNPGHPSKACQGCRALKSKCDEGQPSCKRCTRAGRTCIYAHSDPVFRSMNTWTEKNVKSRVESRLAAREEEESMRLEKLEKCVASVPKLVPVEWTDPTHALGPFFDRFIHHPDHLQSTWGFLPWLPKAYGNQAVTGPLNEATKACALANLANVSKIYSLEALASQAYGSALKGLHVALSKPQTAVSNDSLSTMILLAIYENVSGIKPAKELFHAHMQGQSAALRIRAREQTLSSANGSVMSHTNRWLLWRDMADRRRPTLGLSSWPPNTYSSWFDDFSAQFTVRVADVCGRVRDMQERASMYGKAFSEEELISCIDTAVDLEQSYELHCASCPDEWGFVTFPGFWTSGSALQERISPRALSNLECPIMNWRTTNQPNVQKHYNVDGDDSCQEPYLPRLDSYPSPQVANLWNYLRGARLHLLRTMIDLRLMLDKKPDLPASMLPPIYALQDKISDTIHDTCGSVAYFLGDFYAGASASSIPSPTNTEPYCTGGAIVILWSLHKVCAVPGLAKHIKKWSLDVFERIGTVGNIRQGINLKILYSENKPKLRC